MCFVLAKYVKGRPQIIAIKLTCLVDSNILVGVLVLNMYCLFVSYFMNTYCIIVCVYGSVCVCVCVCVHACVVKWLGHSSGNQEVPGLIPSQATLVLLLFP